jgi:DNA-binding transcriptional LysR family regulator
MCVAMFESQTGLSVDRLRAFCLVVQAGSVTIAAGRDANRQSQFSRQIKELERAIGRPLVRKEGKVLKPTTEGLELAKLAGAFFAGIKELSAEAEARPITVAGGESIIRYVVMPALTRLATSAFQWKLQSMRTRQTREALASGQADLGVVRADAVTGDYIETPAGAIDYTWVFPRRLLPGRTAAGVYEAKRLPFAFLSGDGRLARQIIEVAARNRMPLEIRMELDTFSLLVEAVSMGNLGAVIPRKAALNLAQNEFAVIEDEQLAIPPRPLALVAHRDPYEGRSRLRRAFHECGRVLV